MRSVMRDRTVHPPAFTPNYKTSVLRSPERPREKASVRVPGGTADFGRAEAGMARAQLLRDAERVLELARLQQRARQAVNMKQGHDVETAVLRAQARAKSNMAR